jgi:hypothetical protein
MNNHFGRKNECTEAYFPGRHIIRELCRCAWRIRMPRGLATMVEGAAGILPPNSMTAQRHLLAW